MLVDAATAVVAVGLRFALGRGDLPERWAHPFAAGLGAVAALVVLVHIRVLADPLQTLMLALVVIGGGSLFLSFRWLALLAGGSLLGRVAVMASLRFPPGSRRLGIALLGSWALAAMILGARLRSFHRLEELRAENEARLTRDVTEARGLAESLRSPRKRTGSSSRRARSRCGSSTGRPSSSWPSTMRPSETTATRGPNSPRTLRDVHPPEAVPGLLADLARDASEQDAPLTTRHRKKDGTLIDVEVIAHDIAFGEWNALLAVLTDVTERRRAAEERDRMINELKEALANVKTLRSLIPICASCKKIRDDKGYWSQVEVYVRDRSEAEFTHGICPDCMKNVYGR